MVYNWQQIKMKKIAIILFFLGLGMATFAQNNNSHPEYTCPTGISPNEKTSTNSQYSNSPRNNNSSTTSSQSTTTRKPYSCTSTTFTVAGNGVSRETCTTIYNDGSKTTKTTTCTHIGAKANVGVGEVGVGGKSCVEETNDTPARR